MFAQPKTPSPSLLFNQLPLIELDGQGVIVNASEPFLRQTGQSLSALKGRALRDLADALGGDNLEHSLKAVTAGQASTLTLCWHAVTEAPQCLEIALYPTRDKSGAPGMTGISTDITQRHMKDIEYAAQVAAISRSQAVIEFLPDGTILNANDNFLGLMGYGLEDIKGRKHSLFVRPDEVSSGEYVQFWERLRAGQFASARFRRITRTGREVYIQATYNPILSPQGKVLKIVKFAVDTTEQVLRDADLEAQVNAISRSQAVIEFSLDGTILNCNDNFEKTMACRAEDIRGRHHSLFVTEAMRESPEYKSFWQRLSRGEYVAGEFHRVARDGREVYIQASYNAILDPNGQPYKVVKFAQDVTARRMALNRTTQLSGSLQELSAAVEEMAVTGRSIADAMNQTRQAADVAGERVAEANLSTQHLARATSAMDGIVEMITSITGQINLLALNATIEAARAGEAGKGFAVVATEVKTLANQAKAATTRITQEIEAVRQSARDVTASLDTIRDTVDQVQAQIVFTAGAIEEQSTTSQDMARNMQVASTEAETIVRIA